MEKKIKPKKVSEDSPKEEIVSKPGFRKYSQKIKDQVIISLLGRMTFPEETLKGIITKNKRNPNAYIKGYNACDGKNTVTEIANIVRVNQSTMTPILQDWKVKGIIYEVDSNKGKTYMKLYSLPVPKEKSPKTKTTEEPDVSENETEEIQGQEEQIQENEEGEEIENEQ